MNAVFELVSKLYLIKIESFQSHRFGFVLNTNKGTMLLHKAFSSKENIMDFFLYTQYLNQKAYYNILEPLENSNKLPYFLFEHRCYILFELKGYSDFSYENSLSLRALTKELATAHKFSEGFKFNFASKQTVVNHLEEYKKRYTELMRVKKWLEKQRLSDFDFHFIENFNLIRTSAEESLDILEHSNFESYQRQAEQDSTICLTRLKARYLRQEESGAIYFLNFADIRIAPQFFDLREIVYRHLKASDTELVQLDELFLIYNEIKPISESEKEIVKALLIFPDKYLKICQYFYNKKRSYRDNNMVNRLMISIDEHKRTRSFLGILN